MRGEEIESLNFLIQDKKKRSSTGNCRIFGKTETKHKKKRDGKFKFLESLTFGERRFLETIGNKSEKREMTKKMGATA